MPIPTEPLVVKPDPDTVYTVHVNAIENDTANLTLERVSDDPELAADVPASRTFAFALLADAIHNLSRRDPQLRGAPFADLVAIDIARNEPGFVRALAGGFVKECRCLAHRGADTVVQAAAEFDIAITTTHPAWLAHLSPGDEWNTRLHALDSGDPAPHPPRAPGDWYFNAAPDQDAGLEVIYREDWESEFRGIDGDSLAVPSRPHPFYHADPLHRGDAIDAPLLRSLVGEPVLVEAQVLSTYDRFVGTLVAFDGQSATFIRRWGGSSVMRHESTLAEIKKIGAALFGKRSLLPESEIPAWDPDWRRTG